MTNIADTSALTWTTNTTTTCPAAMTFQSSPSAVTVVNTDTGTLQVLPNYSNAYIVTNSCSVGCVTTTPDTTSIRQTKKVETNMCDVLFILGVPLVIGYLIGRGWDWRYKIVQTGSSIFEIWYKPALWPWWFDSFHRECSLTEARKYLEIFKNSNEAVG